MEGDNAELRHYLNESAHEAIVAKDLGGRGQPLLEKPASKSLRTKENDTYYLDGRIWCDVHSCLMTPGRVPRPGGRVHYYQCLYQDKSHGVYPIKRVNADALHHTVLGLIERAAKHHTFMHKIISESGGWGSATDARRAVRGQLAKKLQFIGVQINNMADALGIGRATELIFNRLESLQAERHKITEELERMDKEIAKATVKRPTAEQVCEAWGRIVDLWEVLTEKERQEVLGGWCRRSSQHKKTVFTCGFRQSQVSTVSC